MNGKNDKVYLLHILESITALEDFSRNLTLNELQNNRLKRSAIVREIEIIGEAVKNISQDLKNKHKEIRWVEIAGTRDKMIHHYFGVDLEIVWGILKNDLPVLKRQAKLILNQQK